MYLSPIVLFLLCLLVLGLTAAVLRLHSRPADPPLPDAKFERMAGLSASDGLVIQTLDAKILWVNPAYCKMMGRDASEMIGRNPLTFAVPDEDRLSDDDIAKFRMEPGNPIYEHLKVQPKSHFRNIRKNGELFWNQITHCLITDDSGETFVVLSCRDVTDQIEKEEELKKSSAQLEYNASHDTLTGAANRAKLVNFVEDALAKSRKTATSVGLIQIDLDKFKEVNDIHGHSAGDAVLQHVTKSAHRVIKRSDLLARMGGDEFVVACTGIETLDELRSIANNILQSLRQSFVWENTRLTCNASIGAALTKAPSDTLDDLLRNSDFALYEVKRRGRGAVAVYDARLHRRQRRQSRRANDLSDAVQSGRIQHHFQPYAEVETGNILGFETLARWTHPEDGLVHPRDFLPLAQDLGLMPDIDFLAFKAANKLRQNLKLAGYDQIGVNINCSGSTLTHPDFRTELHHDIEARGLHPSDLTIEIREAVIFDGEEASQTHRSRIHALREDGFPILLDDFAAGYAGLTHLNQLPISGFKIERAAIHDILDDPTNRKVAAMILELSNDLGLQAVAEGIETEEQAAEIVAIGGRLIQGHLLSPALPAASVLPWLSQRKSMTWLLPSAIAPDDAPRYLSANS